MTRPLFRRAIAVFGVSALFTIAFAAVNPPAKGVTYRLRMSSQLPGIVTQMSGGDIGGPMIVARVKAIGSRARLDIESMEPAMQDLALDAYVLLDSAEAYFVNPAEKSYADGSELFGSGGGLGMIGSVAGGMRRNGRGGEGQADMPPPLGITNVVTDLQQLDGEMIEGRVTKHYLIVAEGNVRIMNQPPSALRVMMEIWTANIPQKIVNPFDIGTTVSPTIPRRS